MSPRRTQLAAALLIIPCLEGQGLAEEAPERPIPELSVGAVNTLTAEARLDNGNGRTDDDDFTLFINRLNVSATTEQVSINARVDGVLFTQTPTAARTNDLRFERLSAELRTGDTTLLAGDFYRQLGRGIVLSLRKVDEVGLDLALRGAEVRHAPEGHSLAAFAGVVNSANLDTVSAREIRDTGDLLAGLGYELSAIEGLTAGVFGLYLQPAERLLDTLDYTLSGGASVELPELAEGLSLYLEVGVENRHLAGGDELGTAGYLTADWALGDFTLLLELLRLDDFEQRGSRNTALGSRFDYNVPPTLERIDQEVVSSLDVLGGRLRAELALLDGDLVLHTNGMARQNDAGATNEVLQLHGYAGAELRFEEGASRVAFSGGYRDERSPSAQLKSMVHFEGDLVKELTTTIALHASSTNELRTFQARDYARGSAFLGAEWASHGSLTFELGYDTQDPSPDVRSLFFAGILTVDLGDRVHLRANAGTQRGGLKCVAGVCRDFPSFAGVRTELVIQL